MIERSRFSESVEKSSILTDGEKASLLSMNLAAFEEIHLRVGLEEAELARMQQQRVRAFVDRLLTQSRSASRSDSEHGEGQTETLRRTESL